MCQSLFFLVEACVLHVELDKWFRLGSFQLTHLSFVSFTHREGSIIADYKVGFKRAVEQDDLPTFLAESVNKAIVDGTLDSVDAVQGSAEFNEGVFYYSEVV